MYIGARVAYDGTTNPSKGIPMIVACILLAILLVWTVAGFAL